MLILFTGCDELVDSALKVLTSPPLANVSAVLVLAEQARASILRTIVFVIFQATSIYKYRVADQHLSIFHVFLSDPGSKFPGQLELSEILNCTMLLCEDCEFVSLFEALNRQLEESTCQHMT